MLNSFLKFLDDDLSQNVIMAATNHRSLLDPTVFRRFQATLIYTMPTVDQARQVLKNNLFRFDLERIDWPRIDGVTPQMSQADLRVAAEDASRAAVLDNEKVLTTELLYRALQDRASIYSD